MFGKVHRRRLGARTRSGTYLRQLAADRHLVLPVVPRGKSRPWLIRPTATFAEQRRVTEGFAGSLHGGGDAPPRKRLLVGVFNRPSPRPRRARGKVEFPRRSSGRSEVRSTPARTPYRVGRSACRPQLRRLPIPARAIPIWRAAAGAYLRRARPGRRSGTSVFERDSVRATSPRRRVRGRVGGAGPARQNRARAESLARDAKRGR